MKTWTVENDKAIAFRDFAGPKCTRNPLDGRDSVRHDVRDVRHDLRAKQMSKGGSYSSTRGPRQRAWTATFKAVVLQALIEIALMRATT
jgi:hypothetical protein